MKKIKLVGLAWFVMLIWLAAGSLVHAAPPVIRDFSSKGCKTINKTGPKDRMYLVEYVGRMHADRDKDQVITFSVKASGADKYVWQVNKKVVKDAAGDTLTWTVPERTRAIWEIHATVSNKDGSAHAEWVVSTLPTKDAPTVFDYFTDKRYANRTETDPWDRPPPSWYVVSDQAPPDASGCYLQPATSGPLDDECNINSTLYLPSDIAFGTWKFRYYFKKGRYDGHGSATQTRFLFIGAEDPTIPPFWYIQCVDSHNYAGLGHMNRIDHDTPHWPLRGIWQEVKIIRTPDGGLFTWVDGLFQYRGRDIRGQKAASLNLKMGYYPGPPGPACNPGTEVRVDMIKIYRNRYLFPPKSIRYGQYIHDWTWEKRSSTEIDRWFDYSKYPTIYRVPPKPVRVPYSRSSLKKYHRDCMNLPVLKKGIVVDGRGVRLQDIAARVRDKSLFHYDSKTKTAVCGTNLVISEAAELILDGETLKFDCKTDGQHEFAVMFGSTLNVKDSTVTTTNEHYFNWRLAGITYFGYHFGPIHNPHFFRGSQHLDTDIWYHGHCTIFMHGSVIDNCGYLFLSSPMQLDITDTKFTNLHEVDTAEYDLLKPRLRHKTNGPKGVKNRFKGKKGFWLGLFGLRTLGFDFRNVSFSGKESPINLTFFGNDTDYKNINIYDVDAAADNIVVRKGLRIRCYRNIAERETTLGLVNTRFRKIIVPTEMARAVVKYYLNVQVTDASGKAIPDARVKVTNEADNKAYPAESIDGVFVVADYVQDQAGKKEFTYTVEAVAPDGKRGKTTGVNPDAKWYRPDAKTPTATVKVVIK